jgi:hypothetical protein
VISQQRGITQQNIRRTKEAAEQWEGFAEEIKAGKRKAFLDHLEERGLLNQVVGSVFLVQACLKNDFLDTLHLVDYDQDRWLTSV